MNPTKLLPESDPDTLPEIVFGILSHNRSHEVIATIDILLLSDYPADRLHILVIDNNSSDTTRQDVDLRFGDRVEVLHLPENRAAVARNCAMLDRHEEYILVFDEDCAPRNPSTLRNAIEFMRTHPEFGALCFRSINAFSGLTEYQGWERLSRRRLPGGAYEGMYVAGNGMCFRRDAIRRTAGYNEQIFWGSEEFYFALELLYHDVRIVYLPHLALIHRRGLRALPSARVLEVEARNNIWAPFMFLPMPLAVLMALLHTYRRIIYALLRARPQGPAAVMRGISQAISGLPDILATRRVIPIRRLADYSRWFIHLLGS